MYVHIIHSSYKSVVLGLSLNVIINGGGVEVCDKVLQTMQSVMLR